MEKTLIPYQLIESKIWFYVKSHLPATVTAEWKTSVKPHFNSYDSWKLASSEDYLEEHEEEIQTDLTKCTEYVVKNVIKDANDQQDFKDMEELIDWIESSADSYIDEYTNGLKERWINEH